MGICASKKKRIHLERQLEEIRGRWVAQRTRHKKLVAKLSELADENKEQEDKLSELAGENKEQVDKLSRQNDRLKEQKKALDEELVEIYAKFHRLREMIN